MLAGAGAAHVLCAFDHAPIDFESPLQHVLIIRIDEDGGMEIAIANVADNGCEQVGGSNIGLGFGDAISQSRDRDANVGDVTAVTGVHREPRIIGIVARAPQGLPVFFVTDLLVDRGLLDEVVVELLTLLERSERRLELDELGRSRCFSSKLFCFLKSSTISFCCLPSFLRVASLREERLVNINWFTRSGDDCAPSSSFDAGVSSI